MTASQIYKHVANLCFIIIGIKGEEFVQALLTKDFHEAITQLILLTAWATIATTMQRKSREKLIDSTVRQVCESIAKGPIELIKIEREDNSDNDEDGTSTTKDTD